MIEGGKKDDKSTAVANTLGFSNSSAAHFFASSSSSCSYISFTVRSPISHLAHWLFVSLFDALPLGDSTVCEDLGDGRLIGACKKQHKTQVKHGSDELL